MRTVGIDSTMSNDFVSHTFARVDDQASFLRSTIATSPEILCGSFTSRGTCVDDAIISCSTQGFSSVDCRADGKTCQPDAQGTPTCACLDCAEPAAASHGCAVTGHGKPDLLAAVVLLLAVASLRKHRRLASRRRGQKSSGSEALTRMLTYGLALLRQVDRS